MLYYILIGANDIPRSMVFYDAVLATIGWSQHAEFGTWRGYSAGGKGENPAVWICSPHDGKEATAGNGMMIAFEATDHDQVQAFYDAGLAHGGSDEGAPGPRPVYGEKWYAAYLRDPTGNKVAIVCNR